MLSIGGLLLSERKGVSRSGGGGGVGELVGVKEEKTMLGMYCIRE